MAFQYHQASDSGTPLIEARDKASAEWLFDDSHGRNITIGWLLLLVVCILVGFFGSWGSFRAASDVRMH